MFCLETFRFSWNWLLSWSWHKNNLSVTVLHNPNFFLCMNYFLAHERNAWWWNLMLFDVVCGYGECRCVQWHIHQELERWIVGTVKSIMCFCRFFLHMAPDLQSAYAALHKLNRKASLIMLAFICDNKKLLSIYT